MTGTVLCGRVGWVWQVSGRFPVVVGIFDPIFMVQLSWGRGFVFRVDDGCQRRQKHYAAVHKLPAQCSLSLAVLQGVVQGHPLPTSGGAL